MSVTQVSVTGQLKVVPAPTALGGLLFAPPASGTVTMLALGSGFSVNTITGTISVAPVQSAPLPFFVDAEVPSGVIDGVNTVFTLANTPNPAASLDVFRNGLRLNAGGDFTLAGAVITFAAGAQPGPSDPLICKYRH